MLTLAWGAFATFTLSETGREYFSEEFYWNILGPISFIWFTLLIFITDKSEHTKFRKNLYYIGSVNTLFAIAIVYAHFRFEIISTNLFFYLITFAAAVFITEFILFKIGFKQLNKTKD